MGRSWGWGSGKDTDLVSGRFASTLAGRYKYTDLSRSYALSRTMAAYVAAGGAGTTPDDADLDITGDLDVRVLCSLIDWSPNDAEKLLATKWTTTGNQRSWRFYVDESATHRGKLVFDWSTNGASGGVTTLRSSAVVDPGSLVNAGGLLWVRVTIDVDNGSSNADVKFYTSPPYDGVNWTQLGTTQQPGATTSIFSSTAGLILGAGSWTGMYQRCMIYSGIAGTLKFDGNFSIQNPGTTSFSDTENGIVVTLSSNVQINIVGEN